MGCVRRGPGGRGGGSGDRSGGGGRRGEGVAAARAVAPTPARPPPPQLTYLVETPTNSEDPKRHFKYPFAACEIFCCEVEGIFNTLLENEDLMDQLFTIVQVRAAVGRLPALLCCAALCRADAGLPGRPLRWAGAGQWLRPPPWGAALTLRPSLLPTATDRSAPAPRACRASGRSTACWRGTSAAWWGRCCCGGRRR